MAEIKDLSTTDASNTGTAANGMWSENMAPSSVNNAARANLGQIARWYADTNGSISTSGSSSAYVLAASRTISTIAAGDCFVFKANHASTGATTIAIDGLATKSIKKFNDQAIAANDIESGSICHIVYDGTNFQLISSLATGAGIASVVADTTPQLGGQLDVNGNALGDGTLELLKFSETGSAVNEFTIANAATGAGPTLSATGTDSNVDINISAKGTGVVTVSSSMNPSIASTFKALIFGF